ncbi:MAG TPA: tetratricopeptide repeat protein [Anaeromyxobacteraceae bacterium]|nr:tetratricopeptide repeat protein [Anaeromyxobacteraceae bacterium]
MIAPALLALLLALDPAPRALAPIAEVAALAAAAGDPPGVAALRARAEVEERARHFPAAIQAYERVLGARPGDLEATVRLARLAAWTGDLDRAVVTYRQALALAPADLGLRSDLADVLAWTQRYEEAERLYEEVLAVEPSHHEALKGLARVKLLRGDLDGAAPLLDRGLASFPGDPDLHLARGRLLAQRGRLGASAEALRRAVALSPTDPEAARRLGEVLFRKGDFDGALVAYQQASALEPESPRHHVMLARIQVALGHLGFAREEVATALRLAPLDAEATELDRSLRKEAAAFPIESLADGLELSAYVALLPIVLVVPWRMRRGLRRRPALRAFAWYVVPSFVLLNLLLHLAKAPLARWVDERLVEAASEIILFLGVGVAFLAAVRRERQAPELAGQVVLAIGAHPDDIELGTAGFLMKLKDSGARVYGLTLTRGEKGGDPGRRPREAERATGFIGLDGYRILDFPDTGLGERIPALRAAIEERIREVGATLVLTHTDVDVHGDHRAVHAATREAARGVPTVLCYEDVSTSKEFDPNYFVDITGYIEDHLKAVAFHRSQEHRTYMDPEVVRGRAAHRGMQIGASFAMAFRTLNLVR